MSTAALQTRETATTFWTRRQFDVVRMSAIRQLKARYRGTFLGVLWSFANPILMTVLYALLFGTAFASYYGGSTSRYVFSVFVAVLLVTFFSQTTAEALGAVVANGGLLNKIAIDAEVFPIAAVAANAFQQSITTFPIIILMTALITHDPVRVVLAPIMLAAFVAMVTGFALALSAGYVFFRDLSHLWGVVGFVFWMTSAVFYPVALVQERIRPWFEINPIGLSIASLRDITLGRGPIDFRLLGTCVMVSLLFLIAGHVIFRATSPKFMDLL